MVTPTFFISLNFFPKSLGIIDTEGKKIIIIIRQLIIWCEGCNSPRRRWRIYGRLIGPLNFSHTFFAKNSTDSTTISLKYFLLVFSFLFFSSQLSLWPLSVLRLLRPCHFKPSVFNEKLNLPFPRTNYISSYC